MNDIPYIPQLPALINFGFEVFKSEMFLRQESYQIRKSRFKKERTSWYFFKKNTRIRFVDDCDFVIMRNEMKIICSPKAYDFICQQFPNINTKK